MEKFKRRKRFVSATPFVFNPSPEQLNEGLNRLFIETPEERRRASLRAQSISYKISSPSPSHTAALTRETAMASIRASTTMLLPPSGSIPPSIRDKAMNDAKDYQRVIESSLKGSKHTEFNYVLKELIGKGSYGRVYLANHKKTGQQVAVKIINIEALDINTRSKPLGLEDAQKEIDILARLRDYPTVNVNVFVEAFSAHEHLCIVSQYCSGGSLTTLRRATPGNRLGENYIRPIARELAFALRSVHAAGIVHRDVKCSNVMVDENGQIQLIDFGVAGIVMTTMIQDKRKTVIGTPHWMPPELQWEKAEIPHGTEVDVWAYGITLYECAMGQPPNANIVNPRQLRQVIRKNKVRLTDESFTPELRDLIEFVLDPDAENRPTMEQVCQHPYILGTENQYPTESLHDLVQQYIRWESQGGVRHSLWMAGGAEKVDTSQSSGGHSDDGWNFSATDAFRNRMSQIDPSFNYSFNPFSPSIPEEEILSSSPPPEDDYFELTAGHDINENEMATPNPSRPKGPSDFNQAGVNADRGGRQLLNLFNPEAPEYEFRYGRSSDLPLRQGGEASFHRQELSVSSINGKGVPAINLEDVSNKKRATMAWTWNEGLSVGPTAERNVRDSDFFADLPTSRQAPSSRQSDFFGDLAPPPRPGIERAATMPVGIEVSDHRSSTLDLDALLGPSSSYILPNQSNTSSFVGFPSSNNNSGYATPAQNHPSSQHTSYGGATFNDFGAAYSEEPMDSFEAEMAAAAASGDEGNNFTMRPATYVETIRRGHAATNSQLSADLVASPAGSSFDDVSRDGFPPSTTSQRQSRFERHQPDSGSSLTGGGGLAGWQPKSRPPAWLNGHIQHGSTASSGIFNPSSRHVPNPSLSSGTMTNHISASGSHSHSQPRGTAASLPYQTKFQPGKRPVFGYPEAFDDRASPETMEAALKFHIAQGLATFDFLGQQLDIAFREEMAHIDRSFPDEVDEDDSDDGDGDGDGEVEARLLGADDDEDEAGYDGGQEYPDELGEEGEDLASTSVSATATDAENGGGGSSGSASHSS